MNFRIGQKLRCIKIDESLDCKLEHDRVYTVAHRTIHDGDTYVTLEEIKSYGEVFPFWCFECAEVMEDADKAVKDLVFKYDSCTCDAPPSAGILNFSLLNDCQGEPLEDIFLKIRWKRSIKNEEYEKSRIYYDELIKRKVLMK